MARLVKVFTAGLIVFGCGWSVPQSISAQASDPRAACAADVQKLCSNVPAGGGRVLACLKQHKDEVSDGCKQAILKAMGQSTGDASSTAKPAPANPTPAPSAPSTPASRTSSNSSKTPVPSKSSASDSSGRYLLMKQVKIIDQGLGQGKPAYDLLIPTTWDFKGWVNEHVAERGCFADWFSVFGTS